MALARPCHSGVQCQGSQCDSMLGQVFAGLQEAAADVRQAAPVLAANLDQVCQAACSAAQRLHSSQDASSLQAVCGVPSPLSPPLADLL